MLASKNFRRVLDITGMEQSIQRFLEATRQLDCFFIQKRMQVSAARPELTGKEVSNLCTPFLSHFSFNCKPVSYYYFFSN